MRRWLVALALVVAPALAHAHVGSPDVFFEGDAGPYRLFVTVRTPQVIPGVATIEIRSESPDARSMTVVPMRLTGPGSELPPTPDPAVRSAADPQFFSADLWLMERGSMQVRIAVDGARGTGQLAVPVPAYAQTTLEMPRGLGALLLGLMIVLVVGIVGILAGAVREATIEPQGDVPESAARRAKITAIVAGVAVTGIVALGNLWWGSEARAYSQMVLRPWQITPRVEGCRLEIARTDGTLLPDHGHLMHLFLVRVPDLDVIAHLHPTQDALGAFTQSLPSLPAGQYQVFADVVFESGFPMTATGTIDAGGSKCLQLAGDDTAWRGSAAPDATYTFADGARVVWQRPAELRARVAQPLRFRVETADGQPAQLEPYMGMAAHAAIVKRDTSVFAHLHPSGSVAMPALELARGGGGMAMAMPMNMAMPATVGPELAFPYGFPQPGDYRIFVQFKRSGVIETAVFDAKVAPGAL